MAAGFAESYIRLWSLKGEKLKGLRSDFQSSGVKDCELDFQINIDLTAFQPHLFPKYVKRREAQLANSLGTVALCTPLPSIQLVVPLHHRNTFYHALLMQQHGCGLWTPSQTLSRIGATKIRSGMSNGAQWEFILRPLVGTGLRDFGQLIGLPV